VEKRYDEAAVAFQERAKIVDARLTSLENNTLYQYTAAVVTDNWGHQFDERVTDLEQRMGNLELIRLAKIRDERDDRVEELEGAVGNLQSWWQELDGYIDDIRYDLHRLSKVPATQLRHPSPQACRELAAAAHSGGFTVDWPDGHRVDSTTRAQGYGTVTTIVPNPANGTHTAPHPTSLAANRSPYHPPPHPVADPKGGLRGLQPPLIS
jgi:hypothetical protein